jgi:hypothetical protein
MNATPEEAYTLHRDEHGVRWGEPFADVLERVMAAHGVEDVEELYERFMEAGHGYIPVPGRHRDKKVGFEEFREHAEARYPYTYVEFLTPVMEVLGVDFDGEEANQLMLSSIYGRNPRRKRGAA